MAKWGSCDFKELEALQKRMQEAVKIQDDFIESCVKELAARLLAKVIKRTPVGKYGTRTVDFIANIKQKNVAFTTKSGKHVSFKIKARKKNVHFIAHSSIVGGTLRKGWTAGNKMGAAAYADTLKVSKSGGKYVIEIINPVEYASYVEYGHRTSNHKGWVPGHFMLTISEKELKRMTPAILEKKLQKFLEEAVNGK